MKKEIERNQITRDKVPDRHTKSYLCPQSIPHYTHHPTDKTGYKSRQMHTMRLFWIIFGFVWKSLWYFMSHKESTKRKEKVDSFAKNLHNFVTLTELCVVTKTKLLPKT